MSNKKVTHIAMLSGGRDSTAMVFEMLDRGMPLDYIIFTDTQSEFPQMYEYINLVELELKKRNNKLTKLQHKKGDTFEDWCFGKITKGAREGMTRGIPMVTQPCYWKRESKVRPFEKFIKDNNIGEYIQYIGYTYSEQNRANVVDTNQRFPLIELRKCEADVDYKLQSIGLINPLYVNFERTGCYFCPYQKIRSFYLLWKLHKDLWNYMRSVEFKLNLLPDGSVLNPQWHIRYTIEELHLSFENKERLYDVESPSACECEI